MAIILSQLTIPTVPTAIQGHPDSNLHQSTHVTNRLSASHTEMIIC